MASTIQFSKTLSFIFDDPQWFRKLGVGLLIAMGCVLFGWLIFPIIFWVCLLEGYQIRMLRNMRDGVEHPLPNWDRMGEMAGEGFRVGLAQLPIWFIALFTFIIPPLGLVGMAVAYFMTNEGLLRYIETNSLDGFFRFGELWKSFRQNMSASLSYGVWVFVLTVILTLLSSTFIGGILQITLQVPLETHLLGQYGYGASTREKPKHIGGSKPKNEGGSSDIFEM